MSKNQSVYDRIVSIEHVDILSVQGMLPYLLQEVDPDRILIYDSIESTNKTAKEMAVSGAEHGTVLIANYQTAGRGRKGRSFHSPPDHGLYMSFILHPMRFCLSTPSLMTAFAAVSVCESIEAISDKTPQIKWVNDVFIDGKKVCGILTEAVTDTGSDNIHSIIVGIGINFSTPAMAFPDDLRHIAGSIFPADSLSADGPPADSPSASKSSAGNPTVTRNLLASEIINRIVAPGDQHNEKAMLEKYKHRMFMLGKTVYVSGTDVEFEAVAVDIDDAGRLIVKRDNGELLSLSSGEISIRET